MKYILTFLISIAFINASNAQSHFVSGPMVGYTELSTSNIWVEVKTEVDKLYLTYWQENTSPEHARSILYRGDLNKEFNTAHFSVTGLEAGTRYKFQVVASVNGKKQAKEGTFKTQSLWPWNKPEDFSFLTGSCSYMNDPKYDSGDKRYGGDSTIFLSMAKEPVDFMLWLGDNWYTRRTDHYSKWGLGYRAHYVRSREVMQPLLQAMPHYAIWDDHDYGPNDAGAGYIYKDASRDVFMNYWANPSYGMDGKGIFTSFLHNDVAFFLLDDRTWRSADDMADSIDGKLNPNKVMYGKLQMDWLKTALLENNKAAFKVIATGSQVLNTYSPFDCLYHFPTEWEELIDFITDEKIEGVIFLTGDRHRSEVIKLDRKDHYTLYDVTCSPMTSKVYGLVDEEKNIPTRVPNTLVLKKRNFSKITVSGPRRKRTFHVDYFDIKGNKVTEWEVNEQELQEH